VIDDGTQQVCDLPDNHLSISDVPSSVNTPLQRDWLVYPAKIIDNDFRVVTKGDGKLHFWNGVDHSFCYTWACGEPQTCKVGTVFSKHVPPHVDASSFCKSCLKHKVVTRKKPNNHAYKRQRIDDEK